MENSQLDKILSRINDLENHITDLASRWLDVNQASQYLHISTSKLRKMVSSGEIPHRRVGKNGKILFSRKQLDLFVIYGKSGSFTRREREMVESWV